MENSGVVGVMSVDVNGDYFVFLIYLFILKKGSERDRTERVSERESEGGNLLFLSLPF